MTSLSEAFGTYAIYDSTPLDFTSFDQVPETHQWVQLDKPIQKIQTDMGHVVTVQDTPIIPVIDLSDSNAMDLMKQACETLGVFQVINHGVPLEMVKKVESEARRLFGLSTNEKRKVLRSDTGKTGYGSAPISPYFDKCMWHEGFTIMGSCVDDAKVLWPNDYHRFCDTMDAYQTQMKSLAHKLMVIILQLLNATQEEINWATSSHQGALQLNSYPSCPNPNRTVGLAPHTDSLLLTILHQGGMHGLEIFDEGSGWTQVQPIEGAFVVNLGDLMHIFSNAKFAVPFHRVMVNQLKQRISFAYFLGPRIESMVAPSSIFRNPCFKALRVKEYISLKAKNYHNALSLIKK
ncbi:gibberellin 3-beta-dioxygenase 1-like [Rutidosis leptorrhynchoides]|uniref:gibberellin 3-beta-dioxygenase 1-like n=1 Tax=Rutidosis leptorrhynchoides TaxID=125765 RepID=UPI003A99E3B1